MSDWKKHVEISQTQADIIIWALAVAVERLRKVSVTRVTEGYLEEGFALADDILDMESLGLMLDAEFPVEDI